MSFTVLALVLAAAFAHAGWNLVAKGPRRRRVRVAVRGRRQRCSTCRCSPSRYHRPGSARAGRRSRSWPAAAALHAVYFVAAAARLRDRRPVGRLSAGARHRPAAVDDRGDRFLGERPSALGARGRRVIARAVFSLAGRRPDGRVAPGTVFARRSPARRSRPTRCGTSTRSARSACRRSPTTGAPIGQHPPSRPWPCAIARLRARGHLAERRARRRRC